MAIKDKYKITQKYITNKLARGGSKNLGVRFFVAHETANNTADADDHYNYFQNITFQASAHTFVDDNKILEIIPLDEKAWHVKYNNDKQTLGLGLANDYAIGTELCRTGAFNDAYDRYVWYHAYLCKKFGKHPRKHITAHKFEDPARRTDPQSWLEPNGITWQEFINDVQAYYDKWEDGSVEPSKPAIKPSTSIAGAKLIKNENAYFLATENIKVRSQPTTKATHTGTFPKGASLNYKRVFEGNGYRWLEYIGNSGNTLYLPYRRLSGDTRNWGTFHASRPQSKAEPSTVIKVGDKVTASRLYGSGTDTTADRTSSITGYVNKINNSWKNPYRLVKTKGKTDYLGFARKEHLSK